MFKKFRELKAHSIFNASNCVYRQRKALNNSIQQKIFDIESRIKFVVDTTAETEVIYCIRPFEEEMFNFIEEHFSNLGFHVVVTDIEGLSNKHMIISWHE